MLPDYLINEYQELYAKHYGIYISKERAQEKGLALANLVGTIAKYKENKS